MKTNKCFRDRDWQNIIFIDTDPETSENNFRDFYYPVFERTKIYRRVTGYFSSSVLNYLCEGIDELIENDGVMYLIAGSELTPGDVDAIKKGLETKEGYLVKTWKSLLVEAEGNIELRNNFEALSWLLANGRLHL